KSSYSSIRKILAFGVTNGYSNGKFIPDKPLKRSDFSAFLSRAMKEEFKVPVNACGYNPKTKTNPDRQTVNCLLTREALR
ncbi:S-layer homology domain-containing protein, partial [Leptospira santarosai]|nr:S-layer homology domain-containing protein [Leptospira santarosai]